MLVDGFGAPQVAALIVIAQRGLEELYSAHNTRRLIAKGAHEEGGNLYPIVAATHLGWIAAIGFLVPPDAPIHWTILGAYLLLQVARYWIIQSLGGFWTHRIITLPAAPVVRTGPYAIVRHPNYLVTVVETALLPLMFGAVAVGMIFTGLWIVVIRAKIAVENDALSSRHPTNPAPIDGRWHRRKNRTCVHEAGYQ
ncbi:MAG: isoprenylcysteine carboxylmethyltransferase family protein [Hyphomicrobiaceae bacterium]